MWKVALNWKASHRIEKMDWASISADLAPIESVLHLVKMKLRKKFDKLSVFDLCNKSRMEVFGSGLVYYTCASSE